MKTVRQSRHLSNPASTFSTSGVMPRSTRPEFSFPYEPLAKTKRLALAVLLFNSRGHMFRISTIDTRDERRLVVEGTLVNPWVAELRRSWSAAGSSLDDRKLVIDLTNATKIDSEGEAAILELIQDGAKFCCSGVHTRHVLKQLASRCHTGLHKVLDSKRRRSEK
jgi:ABC-type transporter Mla MlaB component